MYHFVLCNMCVKNSINWFPVKHSVPIHCNLLINVLLLGQNVEKKNHNGSNTWPDFHNNI